MLKISLFSLNIVLSCVHLVFPISSFNFQQVLYSLNSILVIFYCWEWKLTVEIFFKQNRIICRTSYLNWQKLKSRLAKVQESARIDHESAWLQIFKIHLSNFFERVCSSDDELTRPSPRVDSPWSQVNSCRKCQNSVFYPIERVNM